MDDDRGRRLGDFDAAPQGQFAETATYDLRSNLGDVVALAVGGVVADG